ncbi:MAG TPA: thiamine pyrophosphate-dependent dehydrogenase E1 component subunit alpha [Candidatus Dormibacteraeota bacterium]
MAALSAVQHRELYRLMALTRRVDQEAVALQRQGELTAFPPLTGQEAAQVGSAYALRPDDFVFPSYRELGVAIVRGVDLVEYLRAYRGDWNGGLYDIYAHNFGPIASSVGSHSLHAVGWAMGAALDGGGRAAIVYFGEGATSEGDVHEAMNFAGVFRAPVVFFVQNNQWAISVPVARQTAAPIHRKAEAYGFPGLRIDGNDVLEVQRVTAEALERARAGEGPTLIEALTYRVGAHSTADDPSRYRPAAEVEPWRAQDPLARLAAQLDDEAFTREVAAEVETQVAELRARLLAAPRADPEEMFEFVYAQPPAGLAAQREELRQWRS